MGITIVCGKLHAESRAGESYKKNGARGELRAGIPYGNVTHGKLPAGSRVQERLRATKGVRGNVVSGWGSARGTLRERRRARKVPHQRLRITCSCTARNDNICNIHITKYRIPTLNKCPGCLTMPNAYWGMGRKCVPEDVLKTGACECAGERAHVVGSPVGYGTTGPMP